MKSYVSNQRLIYLATLPLREFLLSSVIHFQYCRKNIKIFKLSSEKYIWEWQQMQEVWGRNDRDTQARMCLAVPVYTLMPTCTRTGTALQQGYANRSPVPKTWHWKFRLLALLHLLPCTSAWCDSHTHHTGDDCMEAAWNTHDIFIYQKVFFFITSERKIAVCTSSF